MNKKTIGRFLVQAAVVLTAACAGQHDDGTPNGDADAGPGLDAGPDPLLAPPECTSGTTRDPNESEGPEMMPGHACVACHALSNAGSGENDAPIFAFAGTLFPTGHEPDDCIGSGAEGARVIVTDASGTEYSATANHSGNFSLEEEKFLLPLTARVEFQGRVRKMPTKQRSGDCNSCHTAEGDEGAPGRIGLP